MIRVVIPDPDFLDPFQFRIQGLKKNRIPDPQHCQEHTEEGMAQ